MSNFYDDDFYGDADDYQSEEDALYEDYLCEVACQKSNPNYFGASGRAPTFENWKKGDF